MDKATAATAARTEPATSSSSPLDDEVDCLMFKKLSTSEEPVRAGLVLDGRHSKRVVQHDGPAKERKRKSPIISLSVNYNSTKNQSGSSSSNKTRQTSSGGGGGARRASAVVAPSVSSPLNYAANKSSETDQTSKQLNMIAAAANDDSESMGGGATSTSEVNSNDDAVSIASRLSQIVVEQEVKLRSSLDRMADEFDFACADDDFEPNKRHSANNSSKQHHNSPPTSFSVQSLDHCCPSLASSSRPVKDFPANLKPVKSSGDIISSSKRHFENENIQEDRNSVDDARNELQRTSWSLIEDNFKLDQQQLDGLDSPSGLPEIQVDNYEATAREAAEVPPTKQPSRDGNTAARPRTKSCIQSTSSSDGKSSLAPDEEEFVSLRRNVSTTFNSNYLPERGDLRSLETARIERNRNEQQQQQQQLNNYPNPDQRMRSNTAGSCGSEHQLMLNICRSAWTLSDFDQTFNKQEGNEALDQQQQQQANEDNAVQIDMTPDSNNIADQQQQQHQLLARLNSNSHQFEAPQARRFSNHDNNLLIRASKNAALSLSQQQSNNSASNYFNSSSARSNKNQCSLRRPSGGHQQQQQQQQPITFNPSYSNHNAQRKHSLQVQDFPDNYHNNSDNCSNSNNNFYNNDYYCRGGGRRPSNSHSIRSFGGSSMDSFRSGKIGSLLTGKKWRNQHPANNHHQSGGGAPTGDGREQSSGCFGCCNSDMLKRCLPILSWLPAYRWEFLWGDLMAGLVVAVLNISTSLSAAVVAETSLGVAFRTSIINTFVYSVLCSSRHTSFGSWSIMSQMLLISVRRALSDELILSRINLGPAASWNLEEYEMWHMNIIIMYTFLIGLVQLVSGLLNLGNIMASFIPEALCSSMIAATAFTMAIGQLANMCGTSNKILWAIEKNTTELWADLKNPPIDITDLFAGLFRWIQQIALLIKYYEQINLVCVAISIGSVLFLIFNQQVAQVQLKRLCKRKQIFLPSELILLILMIIVSYCFDLAETYKVTTCGAIYIDFSWPSLPNLRLFRELWFDSLATALISFTMVYIMAKTYSNKLNYEIDCNQELIACGAGNLIGGLFDALPATASFSRTAGQVEAGGQTQLASLINCFVLIVLAHFLGHHVSVLPVCVMSATLFYGFARMMTRFREVVIYWRICKVDFAIWVVTFVSILTLDMLYGFLYGFIFSILTMLYRAQNRRAYLLGSIIGTTDVYVPLAKYPSARELNGIKIFQFCGPIHYVCADLFEKLLRQKTRVNVKQILADRDQLDEQAKNSNTRDSNTAYDSSPTSMKQRPLPTHIILDFSMISYIDSAGLHVIKKIIEDYNGIQVTVLLASLASHVAKVVKSDSTLWGVYKERFYVTLADAVHYAMRDTTSANANANVNQQLQQLQSKASLSISCDSGGTNTWLTAKE